MGDTCTNCPSAPYSFNLSETFNVTNHTMTSITIGSDDSSITLNGFVAQDRMCMGSIITPNVNNTNNTNSTDPTKNGTGPTTNGTDPTTNGTEPTSKVDCLTAFDFFTVTSMSTGIYFDDTVGGFLGLGFDLPDNGPSFISSLKSQGYIDYESLAVHIDSGLNQTNTSQGSLMTLGGHDPQFMYPNPEEGVFNTYQSENNNWEIEVRGFGFMNQTIEAEYRSFAIIDSFARGVQIPQSEFYQFVVQMKTIFNGAKDDFYCQSYNCFFIDRSCSDENIIGNITNFTIRFNDSIGYTLSPQVFLRDGYYTAGDENLFKVCDVLIYNNLQNQESFVLGDIFSEAYYTQYDYQTQTVGFNGFVLLDLPIITQKPYYQFLPTWGIVLLALAGVGLIASFVYFYIQKRKNDKLNKELGYNDKINQEEIDLDDY